MTCDSRVANCWSWLPPTGEQAECVCMCELTLMAPEYTSPFLVIEEAGKKIGITSVLGERNQKLINNGDITFRGAEEGLDEVWPQLQQAHCDLYVLIAQATMDESIALAKKYPQFSLVVSTGGAGEPTLQPDPVEGTHSQLIQIGTKGMYACVVGLFDDAAATAALSARASRRPFQRFGRDAAATGGLPGPAPRTRVRRVGHRQAQPHPSGRTFAGSASCADCHANAWKVWKEGINDDPPKHSHAFATLQKPPSAARSRGISIRSASVATSWVGIRSSTFRTNRDL